jgi:RNA polymerase sigma-70 factor (subfamily 1)
MGTESPHSDPNLDTLALIRSAREGDRSALDALFLRHYPTAMRVAELRLGRRLRQNLEVEDVVQDAMCRAVRALDGFTTRSDADFKNWLARIVENTVRDLGRRAVAAKRGEGQERRFADLSSTALTASVFPAGGSTPSKHAAAEELEQRMEHILAHELDEPHREVILLRKMCGMSHEEIAKTMGYDKVSTVRSLFTRAMEKLHQALEQEDSASG